MTEPLASERRWTEGPGLLWLWSGVLLAPLGWIVHLNLSYGVATLVCPGSRMWLVAATLVSLACAGVGGVLAWRVWATVGEGAEEDGSIVGRSRFMGVSGVWLSALFGTVILVQSVPPFFLRLCE